MKKISFPRNYHYAAITGLLSCIMLMHVSLAEAAQDNKIEPILARVGDQVITAQDYSNTLRDEARRRFYHGKPSESQLDEFKLEIANKMIDDALLLHEAKRRKIVVDKTAVDKEIEAVRSKLHKHGRNVDDNNELWDAFRKQVEQKQLVKQFRQTTLLDNKPDEKLLRQYYKNNPDKFTEPEQIRVSVILLKVPPSSPATAWQAARQEAAKLIQQVRDGAAFGELARVHSADNTAEKGGDMGYLHRGMLSKPAEQTLDKLAIGDISDPITVLEGIVILQLKDRKAASLNSFSKVRERVKALWQKEENERQWSALLTDLRSKTKIIHGQHYPQSQTKGDRT